MARFYEESWQNVMSSALNERGEFEIPSEVNYVSQGKGSPVLMIHGLAASLHDWDHLLPELTEEGYAGYALDLLGHGESPKPAERKYQMSWLFDHLVNWVDTLHLSEPSILIGHSLGGYLALEFALQFPTRIRGLILVDPFYSRAQLPSFLRFFYSYPLLGGFIATRTPEWLYRFLIDFTSITVGHGKGASHALTKEVRAQTALDYIRTSPGVYNLPNTGLDLTSFLSQISTPTLVAWGEQDRTLTPSSFQTLVISLIRGRGEHIRAGHVPHQSNPEWFNTVVLEFLKSL